MEEESRIDSATAVTRGQPFQVGNLLDGTGEDRSQVDILAAWMEEGWFQTHILGSGTRDGRPRTDIVAVRAGERRRQFGTFAAGTGGQGFQIDKMAPGPGEDSCNLVAETEDAFSHLGKLVVVNGGECSLIDTLVAGNGVERSEGFAWV